MQGKGYHLFNYIDDCIGCDPPGYIEAGFDELCALLTQLGLCISKDKLFAPAEEVTCHGININFTKDLLTIPDDKLKSVNIMCNQWQKCNRATKTQLQSLMGSLLYVHKCVKPARLFTNRILAILRQAPDRGYIKLTRQFHQDIAWFVKFLQAFNGRVFFHKDLVPPITDIYLDASLTGIGGVYNNRVYTCTIEKLQALAPFSIIVHYEMVNILIALRLWATELRGTRVKICCDNFAVVSTLNSGRGRDENLLAMSRNIWLVAAQADIDLEVVHIMGRTNVVADLLSRWSAATTNRNTLLTHVHNPKWYKVTNNMAVVDYLM